MGICESNNSKRNSNLNNRIGQIIQQEKLEGEMPPIERKKEEKINKQIEIYVCKIYGNKKVGTGFLCKIPYPDQFSFLPVLITNKNIINKDELLNEKKIKITFDNDKVERIIYITSERKIYSNKKYDITIIEIIPIIDDIHKFLETDISNENYENIYILQYIKGIDCAKSYGKITSINEDDIIEHNCSKNPGGPILLIDNLKVIGINIEDGKGILLRKSIQEFNSVFLKK